MGTVVEDDHVVLGKALLGELGSLKGEDGLEGLGLLSHNAEGLDARRYGPMTETARFGINQNLVALLGLNGGFGGHRLGNLFLFLVPQDKGSEQAMQGEKGQAKDFHVWLR